jgi:hydrogenase expression/formation protein HypE
MAARIVDSRDVECAPAVHFQDPQIEMAHGAGGKATRRLVEGLLVPLLLPTAAFAEAGHAARAEPLGDAAFVDLAGTRIAMTADSFVVRPLRFPGGSIGELAVNGTVNDLAVAAAAPKALLITLILEAGLPGKVLEAEVRAIGDAARRAGVDVVGGDTKVVEHGKADGMYITTAGIGVADPRARVSAAAVRPGDRILLSGYIGDHGSTVLLARGQVDLDAALCSDTRSIWPLVDRLLGAAGGGVRWMRDPTRGGIATALNELARDTRLGVVVHEERVPVRDGVRGVCELLGLDPLHIANEGQFLAVLGPDYADAALEAIRSTPGGEAAAIVGEVRETPAGVVVASAPYGGIRVIDMLVGDPLPRIC